MNTVNIGNSGLLGSKLVLGCMRIDKFSVDETKRYIDAGISLGINHFDHADIYGNGYCEEIFGQALTNSIRDKILIQSKCGICNGYYDFSKEHIIKSVESSIKRLHCDYLDILLLHRPDTLLEPEEIGSAFNNLFERGLVKRFGVSNCSPLQIELIKSGCNVPIIANQLQFGIMHSQMVSSGIQVNTNFDGSIERTGSVLEYSRLNNITIQAWSPFQYGFFEGVFIGNSKFPQLNKTMEEIADRYGVTSAAIAVAWILRHPAKMQVILGSTNLERISQISMGTNVQLSRKEWYQIYKSAGNVLP